MLVSVREILVKVHVQADIKEMGRVPGNNENILFHIPKFTYQNS